MRYSVMLQPILGKFVKTKEIVVVITKDELRTLAIALAELHRDSSRYRKAASLRNQIENFDIWEK